MSNFTTTLAGFIADPGQLRDTDQALALAAIEDTFSVALAGWDTPVGRATRQMYAGGDRPLIDGSTVVTSEHAALVHAAIGHALDYDDVHLVSTTHPSVVIGPALLAACHDVPVSRSRVLQSFAVGVAINVAIGEAMGFEHYRRGWHATSTIGAICAAAAVSHLLEISPLQIRSALALAVAQAGGMQRNFGSMAKPLQAGFASAAGLRAALLARAGVDGDQDIFGSGGFLDMYARTSDAVALPRLDMTSISMKLFPCCYATHRMIAAALAMRSRIADVTTLRYQLSAPAGQLQPLRFTDPRNGLEAKFCARYTIAAALLRGAVTMADFADDLVHERVRRELMERIDVIAIPGASVQDTLDSGVVTMHACCAGERIEQIEIRDYPGSPRAPASQAQRDAKIVDCLAAYAASSGRSLGLQEFRERVAQLLGLRYQQ